jgi:hypothetical protein
MNSNKTILLLAWLGVALLSRAETTPSEFILGVLDAVPPEQKLILDAEAKSDIQTILGARYTQSTMSYWREGGKTIWILQARGKVNLVDAGFVIEQGRILRCEVLAFRETRGRQIRSKRFLKQLNGLFLNNKGELSRDIDGYSGATYSVNAMRRMAQWALYLDLLLDSDAG